MGALWRGNGAGWGAPPGRIARCPPQPQFPQARRQQPAPAVGGQGGAGAGHRPAQVLLEEAEGMLDREPPLIPVPDLAQVRWQRTAPPDQPERGRWGRAPGEMGDRDPHHGQVDGGRGFLVQALPDLDRDRAVIRVGIGLVAVGVGLGRRVLEPLELGLMRHADGVGALADAIGLMQRTEPNYSARDLAEIQVPVAIVQSEHDEFIKPEHAEYLAWNIPDAELIVLPALSHFAPLQRPERFNGVMRAFVDKTFS